MDNPKKNLALKPFFLFLLPVFFALHGYVEYYNYIPLKSALVTAGKYIALSLVVALALFPLYKNLLTSCLVSFLMWLFYLFFGVIYDFLKQVFESSFLASYTFIIACFAVVLIILSILLVKKKRSTLLFTQYLNYLFLLLILLDLGILIAKNLKPAKPQVVDIAKGLEKFSPIEKPDIYLILLDEYAGYRQLKDSLSFDNSHFLDELKKRGFSVQENSRSNYNTTHYSMASLLNMEYIKGIDTTEEENLQTVFLSKRLIRSNNVVNILSQNNYDIYNYSYFDVADKKKYFSFYSFFRPEESIFRDHTFLTRFYKDAGFRFPWLSRIAGIEKPGVLKQNNNKLDSIVRNIVQQKSNSPRFIYSHFLMPHTPAFYDSSGKETDQNFNSGLNQMHEYVQYLIYTNKKILPLIDHIRANSKEPPIIILMSDHGLRRSANNQRLPNDYMTLNAVFLPHQNYGQFYKDISNVNQFRVILNAQFKLDLPLLKDSVVSNYLHRIKARQNDE